MKSSLFWVMARVDGRLSLNLEELADALGIALQTAYNEINNGTFPMPLRKQGGKWIADARDVAEYLDQQRADARAAHELAQARLNFDPYAATVLRNNGGTRSPRPGLDDEGYTPTPEAIKMSEEVVREIGERWQLTMSERRPAEPPSDDLTNWLPT